MTRHKKHAVKLRSMYQWHRYIGVVIALFIVLLALSGIMLNHTDRFELDKTYIESDWLLNLYGISAPDNITSYSTGQHWVSQWDRQLYLDSRAITQADKQIVGAVFYQDMIIIAQENALFAYTTEGDLIEKMSGSEGIPSGIEALGITDEHQLAVRAANGTFTTNQELLFWQNSPSAISVWSDNNVLPENRYQKILKLYRGKGLKLERVILDLHSGRLPGQWGVYFMDFVALLMIFLASSGFWLWAMRLIKKNKRKQH